MLICHGRKHEGVTSTIIGRRCCHLVACLNVCLRWCHTSLFRWLQNHCNVKNLRKKSNVLNFCKLPRRSHLWPFYKTSSVSQTRGSSTFLMLRWLFHEVQPLYAHLYCSWGSSGLFVNVSAGICTIADNTCRLPIDNVATAVLLVKKVHLAGSISRPSQ